MPDKDAARIEKAALVLGDSVAEIARRGLLQYVDALEQTPQYTAKARERAEELRRKVQDLLATGAEAG